VQNEKGEHMFMANVDGKYHKGLEVKELVDLIFGKCKLFSPTGGIEPQTFFLQAILLTITLKGLLGYSCYTL